jgi:hypothetical protein
MSNLSTSIAKATDTYDVIKQIPGVSQESLSEFSSAIDDVKTFYKSATNETADAIASKRDLLEIKDTTICGYNAISNQRKEGS